MDRKFELGEMIKVISAKEFRESGMLWYINQQLHMFGMALVVNIEEDTLKPAFCRFRGFSTGCNEDGYEKVTKYLKDNIESIGKDLEDDL